MNGIESPKEKLNLIVEQHGIEVIKNFIIEYNKEHQKWGKKDNRMKEIGIDFYTLRYKHGYNYKSAIKELSNNTGRREGTIKEYVRQFNRYAEKNMYYQLGKTISAYVEEWTSEEDFFNIINDFANKNNNSFEETEIFYLMYKNYNKKKVPDEQYFNIFANNPYAD